MGLGVGGLGAVHSLNTTQNLKIAHGAPEPYRATLYPVCWS